MSFKAIMLLGLIILVTCIVSDWFFGKLFKLLGKIVAKRREKKRGIEVVQRMEDFGFTRVDNPNILPAEELFEED